MSEQVEGKPTKSLFIDTLTKDIELIDAVNDLVDNSIDAAFRLKGKVGYTGMHIKIFVSPKMFEIEDNCGGIDLETAQHVAFRLGRPSDTRAQPALIARYGIGMKRAFFKIGRHIVVDSYTKHSHLVVTIPVDQWKKDDSDNWDFTADVFEHLRREVKPALIGTRIEITELHREISREIVTPAFTVKLVEILQKKHKHLLQDGLSIFVGTTRLVPKALTLKNSDLIKPAYFDETFDGRAVKPLIVKIMAGVDESDPKEAGWYVCCNGRFILESDQSIRTGWGEVGDKISIPKSHHQFARFRGYAFFECEDPGRIPWNSTKTGVDM